MVRCREAHDSRVHEDIGRIESSGAEDSAALLEPGGVEVATAGGVSQRATLTAAAIQAIILRESPYEGHKQEGIRCPVTVSCEISERWNAEELLLLPRLARGRTSQTSSGQLETSRGGLEREVYTPAVILVSWVCRRHA